jgi:hypothetical protein
MSKSLPGVLNDVGVIMEAIGKPAKPGVPRTVAKEPVAAFTVEFGEELMNDRPVQQLVLVQGVDEKTSDGPPPGPLPVRPSEPVIKAADADADAELSATVTQKAAADFFST